MDLDREMTTIDLVRFEQWSSGNDTRLREIIEIYRTTMTSTLALANAAHRAGDATGLRRAAHDLKNCFLIVGARQATSCAEKIEAFALDGTITDTRGMLDDLEAAAAAIDGAMARLLEGRTAT